MPPLPVVPSTIRIRLTGNDNADANIQNSLWFTYSGTAGATDINTLMGIVASAWSSNIASHHPTSYHLVQIQITDLASKLGAQVAEQLSIAGTNANPETPSGVACVLRREESDQYRGGHGRLYLGGRVMNDLQDMNTWTVAFQTAMATAWQAFVNQIISAAPAALGALKDVVVHRFGPSTLPPLSEPGYKITKKSVPLNPPVLHPVTGYTTNPQVASQRRRNQQSG